MFIRVCRDHGLARGVAHPIHRAAGCRLAPTRPAALTFWGWPGGRGHGRCLRIHWNGGRR